MSIGRRLFKAIDQMERKTLNREEATEFATFLWEHLFHGSFKEERDLPTVQRMLDTLPFENTMISFPNSRNPKAPIVVTEPRVVF